MIPVVGLMVGSVVVLSLFTSLVQYDWQREVEDELTGESFGYCKGSGQVWFWFAFVMICCILPMFLALFMAWKTKDVDDSFSESWWIFVLVLVQIQVSFLIFH
jgi:hypothetical protein